MNLICCFEMQRTGEVETGVRITSASKILFNLFREQGKRIRATGREYATVMLLIRLLKLDVVRKPIVFCPSGMSCRRCMALFKLLSRRHLVMDTEEIGCAHVFQSYKPGSSSDSERLTWYPPEGHPGKNVRTLTGRTPPRPPPPRTTSLPLRCQSAIISKVSPIT